MNAGPFIALPLESSIRYKLSNGSIHAHNDI